MGVSVLVELCEKAFMIVVQRCSKHCCAVWWWCQEIVAVTTVHVCVCVYVCVFCWLQVVGDMCGDGKYVPVVIVW